MCRYVFRSYDGKEILGYGNSLKDSDKILSDMCDAIIEGEIKSAVILAVNTESGEIHKLERPKSTLVVKRGVVLW